MHKIIIKLLGIMLHCMFAKKIKVISKVPIELMVWKCSRSHLAGVQDSHPTRNEDASNAFECLRRRGYMREHVCQDHVRLRIRRQIQIFKWFAKDLRLRRLSCHR